MLRASVTWQTPPLRYAEIIGLVKVDKRTGEEIAADIIRRHGLKEAKA